MKKSFSIAFIVVSFNLFSQDKLFTFLKNDETNIDFVNYIRETQTFNIFNFEYLYNGSGTALADFNNDGLIDIFFSANMVENRLYLNKGNLKFEDISEKSGIEMGEGFKTGATIVDINNDGYPDIYECASASPKKERRKHHLYVNNGDLTFTESSEEYGLIDFSYSTQAYFHDMDKDGDLDMYLLNYPKKMDDAKKLMLAYNENNELEPVDPKDVTHSTDRYFENVNGKFIDKTESSGIKNYSFGLSALFSDFNDDGWPDIYVCNDYLKPDFLYLNNGNGTFTEDLSKYFNHICYNAMGSTLGDLNNDGYEDVVVLDMLSEDNYRQKQFRRAVNYDEFEKFLKYDYKAQFVNNTLQVNLNGNGFEDRAFAYGMAFSDWSWCPLMMDLDNNGHKDVYITNGYFRETTDMDLIKFRMDSILKVLNFKKKIEDVTPLFNTIATQKVQNYVFMNKGGFQFEKNPIYAGLNYLSYSTSAVYGDLDNDGDLDIVVNNINQHAFLFKNNTIESGKGNFLRFKLTSNKGEANTFGTKITVITPDGNSQLYTYDPKRGYMNYNESFVHVGVAKNTTATVIVETTSGIVHKIDNIEINKVHKINVDNLVQNHTILKNKKTYFEDITNRTRIFHKHTESDYNDYKLEPLLPKKYSRLGPTVAVADINGDGLDDIFIGGASGNSASVQLQREDGSFLAKTLSAFVNDSKYEDVGSAFGDIDNDGDMDLIVTSGGNDYPNQMEKYPVRCYLNDGNGSFTKLHDFPKINVSSKTVKIFDINKDGYPEIFIGGHIVPGRYGEIPPSYYILNTNGVLRIDPKSEAISQLGMVTDATLDDINNDGHLDLVVVGEWMTPTAIFSKNGTLFPDKIQALGNNYGWWTSISSHDIFKNGKSEVIFGNYGINSRYKGFNGSEMKMIVNDFDKNGSIDAVVSTSQKGKDFPMPILTRITDQMPFLKKRFNRFHKYSIAEMKDIFTAQERQGAKEYKANMMYSLLASRNENNQVQFAVLPQEAQVTPVHSINYVDFDRDGDIDLILSGNDYDLDLESARQDGNRGLVLENVNGQWKANYNTGFFHNGNVKTVVPITIKGQKCWIVGKNNDNIQVIGLK